MNCRFISNLNAHQEDELLEHNKYHPDMPGLKIYLQKGVKTSRGGELSYTKWVSLYLNSKKF